MHPMVEEATLVTPLASNVHRQPHPRMRHANTASLVSHVERMHRGARVSQAPMTWLRACGPRRSRADHGPRTRRPTGGVAGV
jgi:hypothetical protein